MVLTGIATTITIWEKSSMVFNVILNLIYLIIILIVIWVYGDYYFNKQIIKAKSGVEGIKIDILIRNPFHYIEDFILLFIQSNNIYGLRSVIDYALRNTDEHIKIAEQIGNIKKDLNEMRKSLKYIEDRDKFIQEFNKIIDKIDNVVKFFISKKDQWKKEFTKEQIENFINLYNIMCIKLDAYYDINDWGYHTHLNLLELIQRKNINE